MDFYAIVAIAVALAMDAFAVALSAGVVLPHITGRHLFRLSFHFGLFQGAMPVIGWYIGSSVQSTVAGYAHWVAFVLLMIVGGRMIYEACDCDEDKPQRRDPTRGLTLIILAVATSIDALAVGLSFALLDISIWYPSLIIGIVAAVFTVAGMLLGRRIGSIWGKRSEIAGGILLCLLGAKILLEHLFGG